MRSILPDTVIAQLIEEDVPYVDLTTWGLKIGQQQGEIEFYARHPLVVCGTEEGVRVFEQCGAKVATQLESGSRVDPGQLILKATGPAEALHIAWRIALNLLEYASGIASRTAVLVEAAHQVNPSVGVVGTRKVFPGTRRLSMKALLAGGAVPHRLGLSETILIFKEHLTYLGGQPGLLEQLPELRQRFQEHKIGVEVETAADAWIMAQAGVDILQLDKLPSTELQSLVSALNHQYPTLKIAVAGGITQANVQDYASTGVDLLVTSYPYFGKPADIGVKMFNFESSGA